MTIQKKIMISNIVGTMITALMICLICAAYAHFHSETLPNRTLETSGGVNRLTKMMNILYAYEAEISGMDWQTALPEGAQETELMLLPEAQRITELQDLGYHIQIESPYKISFTNLDALDQEMLAGTSRGAENASYMTEKGIIVRDSISFADKIWYLTAVYNEDRADKGVLRSMTPLYLVPHGIGISFFLITLICIVVVSVVYSRYISKMILGRLQRLKKGAAMVAEGNLDYPITYTERDEYGEIFEEFDRMRRQLKEARERQQRYEQQQRDQLRGITHDLRSPLTSIKGYALGIKDGIANTPEKRTRYCDAILTRADDLERLTGSLSILVRMDTGSNFLHLERVNLDEYIRQFLSEKEAWLVDRKVDVQYRTDAPEAEVRLDIREMQRVFMNLMENTVRYRTAECSKVDIEVRQNTENVEIRFSDDGPGVGRRHLARLFEPFYRADQSRTAPEKGSGIGLTIVKRIIEGHGGQVSASSEGGLCIAMTLPVVKGESGHEENTDR